MSEQHGTVCWSELMTGDVAKAKAYYTAICGWEFDTVDMGQGDYHIGRIGEKMIAGIMDTADMPGMEGTPDQWVTYLAVDDVDAAAKETEANGGTVHQAPFDVAGVGRIAMVADPGGASFGLMTQSD